MATYNFIARLEAALRGDEGSKPPIMVEAARKYRQAKIIAESRAPQLGAFWLVPDSTGNWELYSFFESNYPKTDHAFLWPRYVSKMLFDKPSVHIMNAYAGLPRGRVVHNTGFAEKDYIIYHGNDLPGGAAMLRKVAREFNLPMDNYVPLFEEHEQMIPEHYRFMQKALGYKQKLAPPAEVDFGDDDIDDDF